MTATINKHHYQYKCTLKNGRVIKFFRTSLFRLAEECVAFVRSAISSDGIHIVDRDITIQLVFKEIKSMYGFRSAVMNLCVKVSSNKRLGIDKGGEVYNFDDYYYDGDGEEEEGEASVHDAIQVFEEMLHVDVCVEAELHMVHYHGHHKERPAANRLGSTYHSLPCDACSDDDSIDDYTCISPSEAETRVQMLENHCHSNFHRKNATIVHIKSKNACRNQQEMDDTNNHLYMSYELQVAFNGIVAIIPNFLIRYVSHDEIKVDCPKIGDKVIVIYPNKKRQRTIIQVIFYNEQCRDNYLELFRDGYHQIDLLTIEMELYFEDAMKAKRYIDWREREVLHSWAREH